MQEGKEWKLKLWKNGSVLLCLTSQITTEQMTISISNKSLSHDGSLLFMFLTRFPTRECNFSNTIKFIQILIMQNQIQIYVPVIKV